MSALVKRVTPELFKGILPAANKQAFPGNLLIAIRILTPDLVLHDRNQVCPCFAAVSVVCQSSSFGSVEYVSHLKVYVAVPWKAQEQQRWKFVFC